MMMSNCRGTMPSLEAGPYKGQCPGLPGFFYRSVKSSSNSRRWKIRRPSRYSQKQSPVWPVSRPAHFPLYPYDWEPREGWPWANRQVWSVQCKCVRYCSTLLDCRSEWLSYAYGSDRAGAITRFSMSPILPRAIHWRIPETMRYPRNHTTHKGRRWRILCPGGKAHNCLLSNN